MLSSETLLKFVRAQEARVVINMKVERGDPSVWKEVHQRGKQIQLCLTLGHACQDTGLMSHPQSQSPTSKELCISLLLIIQEMNDRLLSQGDRFVGLYHLP